MRTLILIAILALTSSRLIWDIDLLKENVGTQDNKEDLQKIFIGLWEYAHLQGPHNVIDCFDEQTAEDTSNFIGQGLMDIASGDKLAFARDTTNFSTHFPPATLKCILADPEVVELGRAYNITNRTPTEVIKQIITYINTNFKKLKDQASSAYFDWSQGMYEETGNKLGKILAQIFNSKRFTNEFSNSKVELQNLYNGLFEDVQLPGPRTLLDCYSENDATLTLNFYKKAIKAIATNNYPTLVKEFYIFKNTLPKKVAECVNSNSEFLSAYDAYGLKDETLFTFGQKYAKFYLNHQQELISSTNKITEYIEDHDFYLAGKGSGTLIQKILANN